MSDQAPLSEHAARLRAWSKWAGNLGRRDLLTLQWEKERENVGRLATALLETADRLEAIDA